MTITCKDTLHAEIILNFNYYTVCARIMGIEVLT